MSMSFQDGAVKKRITLSLIDSLINSTTSTEQATERMNMAAKNGLRCLVLFCIVAFAVGITVGKQCPKTDKSCVEQYSVELDIFSGLPNPKWVIIRSNKLFAKIDKDAQAIPSSRPPSILGYRGFYIESTNGKGQKTNKYIGAGTNPSFETVLFDSNPDPLPTKIRERVTNSKNVREKTTNRKSSRTRRHVPTIEDFSTNPRFDPQRWNERGVRGTNNCYNYATQRRTDTLARPGRASRRPDDPFDFFRSTPTAENVMALAVRDGFIDAGRNVTMVPPTPRDEFCYMALFIWPNYDFHWYRRDNDTTWSHKIGGTNAKNTDHNGATITDPKTANTDVYTQFAGFVKNFWGPNIA